MGQHELHCLTAFCYILKNEKVTNLKRRDVGFMEALNSVAVCLIKGGRRVAG